MFFVSAIAFSIFTYKPIAELWDDTLGSALRQRNWDMIRNYEFEEYSRIFKEEGQKAAIKYQMTPKAAMPTGPLQLFEDWHWVLAVVTLLLTVVALYHLIWKCGAWALRYVVHGSKAEQGATDRPE